MCRIIPKAAKIKATIYEASLNAVEHSYFSNPDYWIDRIK
jgi:anti-sigma regulatory factor (Ser/Thr protein kinase)